MEYQSIEPAVKVKTIEKTPDKRLSEQRIMINADSVDNFVAYQTDLSVEKLPMKTEHEAFYQYEKHLWTYNHKPNKNRFSDTVCFFENSVILKPMSKKDEREERGNYYHATRFNNQFGNYIMAQGPNEEILTDFYRMIWQYNIRVIVRLSKEDETIAYFIPDRDHHLKVENKFTVRCVGFRVENEIPTYELMVRHNDLHMDRIIFVILGYNDPDTPNVPRIHLEVLRQCWVLEKTMLALGYDGPTLIHGDRGSRRTTGFVATSIMCKMMEETGKVAILETWALLRDRRHGTDHVRHWFISSVECLIQYAIDIGRLKGLVVMSNEVSKGLRDLYLECSHKDRSVCGKPADN